MKPAPTSSPSPSCLQTCDLQISSFPVGRQVFNVLRAPGVLASLFGGVMFSAWGNDSVLFSLPPPRVSLPGFFEMKMKYDESDNAFIRASRAVTDKVTDLIGSDPSLSLAYFTHPPLRHQPLAPLSPSSAESRCLSGRWALLQDGDV